MTKKSNIQKRKQRKQRKHLCNIPDEWCFIPGSNSLLMLFKCSGTSYLLKQTAMITAEAGHLTAVLGDGKEYLLFSNRKRSFSA